ncbi:hypothetical protein AVEN_211377-1 [Araneus ventricosus]|uniref:Integrase catalytic domain-containing protein n=1 Tax=Araneus ventricosus TaxID=182803 RepID=A0A4Y2NXJ3_ARAVE|nr:hypothetical protein AVEN_211377-1 [Araneus ventricosus]
MDESYSLRVKVFSEDKICGTVPKVSNPTVINELSKKGIILSDLANEDCEIGLLLGADVVGMLFMEGSVKLDSGLFLLKTRLGFVLTGKQEVSDKYNERCDTVLNVISLFVKDSSINELWSLENIGIFDPIQRLNENNEHLKVIEEFKNSMKILPDGRYELCLPFKSDVIELPSNKELTWKRHKKMCERAQRNGLLDDYKAVFKEWEELKIIEKIDCENETSHFLPHRPVVKTDSMTTKIRPVFDASARETGKNSLNDLLYKGPNLIEQIPDIIDRFRSYPIGISADIEKAFLQLGIAPEHRDFLRFFYPTENEEIIYRHSRVVFGVSSSPFLLAAALSHLLEHVPAEDSEIADKLKLSFYVDNCVSGVSNATQQEKFILKAREILSRGCFNIRNWESNVECKYISKSTGTTKLLGILWDLDKDVLKCRVCVEDLKIDSNITKRFILAAVQRIFDPLGILCSATLPPKILLQNTWKSKLSWDSTLLIYAEDDIVKPFLKWWGEVAKLSDIEIPRHLEINDTTQMHVFVDACKEAYATCIFLRTDTSQGVKVVLVRAKSRVVPLKQATIPRLELMACCIGARLAHSVQQALNITEMETIFWSDSMVALYWLSEKGGWSVFVSNRIKEIKTLFPNGGRRTVRKIWNACVRYRRFKSKSPTADPVSLPSDRVKDAAVFEVVGVDLAGPLYIKQGTKVWAVLYTCALYRALHLELVSSLSTDAFLLSFRRFVARRGRPRIIYSDNGTNFRGAYNELAAIDWNEVSRYAEIQRITWKFIPPTAAWWGGFWERLVRTVKDLLRRTLGKAIFTYEELLTILCECEKVVNSRPLTYLSEDMQNLTPVTPAMCLFDISTAEVKDLDVRDANHFRKRLRFRAKVIEELRKRFRSEYLGQLIQRQKQDPQSSNIREGDIVLIGDDVKKRLQWPLARVIELIPGNYGLVRTVKLKTQSSTLIRPIQRLFPLELSGNDLTSLPLQKVELTVLSVNSPNPETSVKSPIPDPSKANQPQVTRCGRAIKRPKRLNLVTLNDVFE